SSREISRESLRSVITEPKHAPVVISNFIESTPCLARAEPTSLTNVIAGRKRAVKARGINASRRPAPMQIGRLRQWMYMALSPRESLIYLNKASCRGAGRGLEADCREMW